MGRKWTALYIDKPRFLFNPILIRLIVKNILKEQDQERQTDIETQIGKVYFSTVP